MAGRESADDSTKCYCFGVTVADLEGDFAMGKPERSFNIIAAQCSQGMARCATMNPSGRCCLSQVRAWIQARRAAAAAGKDLAATVESPIGRNCCAPSRVQPTDAAHPPKKGMQA